MIVSPPQRRYGENEDQPCHAELVKEVMCFSVVNRGIQKYQLTDAFGLMCPVRIAKGRQFHLVFAAHPASPNKSSASTSGPRASIANILSKLTQHRPLHFAPKRKVGLTHFPRGDVSRSNPPQYGVGSTLWTNGSFRILVRCPFQMWGTPR